MALKFTFLLTKILISTISLNRQGNSIIRCIFLIKYSDEICEKALYLFDWLNVQNN